MAEENTFYMYLGHMSFKIFTYQKCVTMSTFVVLFLKYSLGTLGDKDENRPSVSLCAS